MNKLCLLAAFLVCLTSQAATVTWTGAQSSAWESGLNWDNSTGPAAGDLATINSGTVIFSTGTTPNHNALRFLGGTLTFSGGTFTSTNLASSDSHVNGTLYHTGTVATINEVEIGRTAGSTGLYYLSGGSLKISRGLGTPGYSLYLGANKTPAAAGTGTLEISGGGLSTRSGVKLGDATLAGTGKFTVLGSAINEIGIGTANTDTDGTWKQHAGSTLKVGVDISGARKIFIKDSATATTGTSATFEAGSLLDVGYYNNGTGGGTWTVMEVENGPVVDNGLVFAAGVNTSIWSKAVDNSGPNGKLIITAAGAVPTGNVFWNVTTSSAWETATNWTNGIGPVAGDYVYINYGTVNYTATTGSSPSMKGLRLYGGTLNLSGGTLSLASLSSADSHVDGAFVQTGGAATINELEVGRTPGRSGSVVVSGGSLNVSRALSGYSLYLGANRSADAGTGSIQVSGGSLVTRSGVKLGDATRAGTGKFTVLGSGAIQIGIGASATDTDGTWKQHAGSTLKVGIDFGGLTPIVIKDSATATTGTSATFESGSWLDVGYYNTGYGGGTWTVMEVENGPVVNNGLAFAPGVDTAVWSFAIDNSGPNGRLTVTATGTPAGLALNVGSTKKQKMRYGMDYERLWYWTNSTSAANKANVTRWSTVDCDIDYIRVAMVCGYELNEGSYDLTAYTDKVIPMMQAMKAANPNIKFFATPRPLNEDVSNATWQPYPIWITGAPSYTSSSFNFNHTKCAQYLLRYLLLMKSYGFKISYMDLTNEWNNVTATDVRDISDLFDAYLLAPWSYAGAPGVVLTADDLPLLVAPSAWSYSQGSGWLSGVNTATRRNALDIASCHNTDKTGTAQDFANKVFQQCNAGTEIWNTELHGWKSTSGADEVLSSAYVFECIRAGFSGMSGWLAIGTTNQGHSYILNPSGTPSRNVKYFIFRKLTTTSNYGHALDVNQPAEFAAAAGSDEEDAGTSTAALIRGNLMTVWVMNHATSAYPVIITPTGRTLSETSVKRTVWNTSLAVEGVGGQVPVTTNAYLWTSVPARSLVCYDILLDPIGPQYKKFEAENFAVQSGTTTETTTDIGGGRNVGNIVNDTWLRFDNLAPGTTGTIRFRVARPAGRPDGRIEIRQGSIAGPVLGSVAVPETGGWQTWETIETPLAPVTGSQSLFLKFVESGTSIGDSMFNLNWFSIIVPPVPAGLAATPNTATQTTLNWTSAAGATSYEVLRATVSGGPYTVVVTGLTTTSFTDTGLTAGTSYYYIVRAIYPEVASPHSIEIRTVPSAPIDPKDVVIASTSIGSDGAGGQKMTLSIAKSGIGHFYRAQSSPSLSPSTWTNASGVIQGNGGLLQIEVPIVPGTARAFYKVNVWRE